MSGEWRQREEADCSPRFSCSGDGGALLQWQYIHEPQGWRKLGGPAFPRGQGVAQGPGIRGKWNQEPEEEISARRGSGRRRRGIIGREGGIHP